MDEDDKVDSTQFNDGIYVFESFQNEWARYVDVQDDRDPLNIIFYEFKSVKPDSFKDEDFVNQFVKDLSNNKVSNLSQIQWIFDHTKMTQAEVKEKVINALVKYKEKLDDNLIINKFNGYAASIDYVNDIENIDELIEFLKNNNVWYNVIFK